MTQVVAGRPRRYPTNWSTRSLGLRARERGSVKNLRFGVENDSSRKHSEAVVAAIEGAPIGEEAQAVSHSWQRSARLHDSPASVIAFLQASSFGNMLGHLPAELQEAARTEIERELEALRTAEGIRIEAARLVAVAVKP